ncbi:MAG: VOC family protein [Planctomycetaceae bacterium]
MSQYRKYAAAPNTIFGPEINFRDETEPPMHANNVCHFAIHADDVERAKTFYADVFGWRFEEWGPPEFYLIHTGPDDSTGIRGALQQRQQPVGTGFNGYECSISVADVTKTAESIVQHGGTIVYEEVEIPTVGRIVKFADTEGNTACVIQYAEGVM